MTTSPADQVEAPAIVYVDTRANLPGWAYRIINGAEKTFPGRVLVVVPRAEHVERHLTDARVLSFPELSGLDQVLSDFRQRYVHLSTAPETYERSCFERFLVLHALMDELGLGCVWHLDIDALPLKDLMQIELSPLIRDPNFWALLSYDAIPMTTGPSVSAGNSLLTASAVRDFTALISGEFFGALLPELRKFFSMRVEQGLPGGVCDMTAWGVVALRRNGNGMVNSNSELPAGVLIPNSLYGLQSQLDRAGLVRNAAEIRLTISGSSGAVRLSGVGEIPLGLVHFSGADKEVSRWLMSGRPLTLNGWVHQLMRGGYRLKRRVTS